MNASLSSRRCRVAAFTLVELLVVIGIIALLISILLPTLGRAKEQARKVACMSNLRQLTMATLNFAAENRGLMPARGGRNLYKINADFKISSIAGDYDPGMQSLADWICWQRHKDPITGVMTTAPDLNITYSALARHMGIKWVSTGTNLDAANTIAAKLDGVFRCPSDNLELRPSANDGSSGAYRYSYAMNVAYTNPVYRFGQTTAPVAPRTGDRNDGTFTGKISSIRHAVEKVLLICQDEQTANDGEYSPRPHMWNAGTASSVVDLVAGRHDKRFASAPSKLFPNQITEEARGNVGFCDGHVEFFGRKDALRQKHTGNPNPDPQGF